MNTHITEDHIERLMQMVTRWQDPAVTEFHMSTHKFTWTNPDPSNLADFTTMKTARVDACQCRSQAGAPGLAYQQYDWKNNTDPRGPNTHCCGMVQAQTITTKDAHGRLMDPKGVLTQGNSVDGVEQFRRNHHKHDRTTNLKEQPNLGDVYSSRWNVAFTVAATFNADEHYTPQ